VSHFDTILIANRGEIACRILRTAKAMGLRTVALASTPDLDAPHARLADKRIHLDGNSAAETYLDYAKFLPLCEAGWAVHPGYGFLSENADFAKAVADAGLIFIGPSSDAITLMGDKAQAKRAMIDAGVPVVPGYQGADQSEATLIKEAKAIGVPLMVKAAAGGGGRGLRAVTDLAAVPEALTAARQEALASFGSGELILERQILRPRHVEIQVFGDTHGNILHLGERDCSVQRRHQKVLEEAPCPALTPALREAMGKAAINAAKRVNYFGAGTVEFLLDDSEAFYFLEMNTRLQVEHPVTEWVTGLDLVAWQIRVARGEVLPLSQSDMTLSGHAIEARLYAEDPAQDFLPATGDIALWRAPCGAGVRVDSGIAEGSTVSPFYDPLLAKIIASGPDRATALSRLKRALAETVLHGVTTNRAFLLACLDTDIMASGEARTDFIETHLGETHLGEISAPTETDFVLGAVAHILHRRETALAKAPPIPDALLGWSSATALASPVQYDARRYAVFTQGADRFIVTHGEARWTVERIRQDGPFLWLRLNGETHRIAVSVTDVATLHLSTEQRDLILIDQLTQRKQAEGEAGGGRVTAPMHGVLTELRVRAGDAVTKGQTLAVLEAMKMQHPLRAAVDGTVTTLRAKIGDQLASDALILLIEPTDTHDS